MSVRTQNLETAGAVYLSFAVQQTGGIDDLTDADLGKGVELTDDYEVTAATAGGKLLGKLIALTLSDADSGQRQATVQVAGVMSLPISTTYPVIGNQVVGGGTGTIKQSPALAGNDPAGGNIAHGNVIAVNGTTSCTLIL
jgi:hypothetical protein